MGNRVLLLVGTRKGLFTFESDTTRRAWREAGPLLSSWEVTGLLGDSRHGHRLFAGTGHMAYGPMIRVSLDFGETWTQMLESPRYPPDGGRSVHRIWQILSGTPAEPDTFFAGVDEAGFFVSRDGGRTWRHHDTLAADPSRPRWSRTQAGNPLHSLLLHPQQPQRLWGLVGGAGVVYSGNGGVDWEFRNAGRCPGRRRRRRAECTSPGAPPAPAPPCPPQIAGAASAATASARQRSARPDPRTGR